MRAEYLLNRNKNASLELERFLKSDYDLFLLKGAEGSGKTSVLKALDTLLKENVVCLKYYAKASSVLDDVLLSLLAGLKEYAKREKLVLKKPPDMPIRENVNFLVKSIERPVVVVIEDYEPSFGGDILDFVTHLVQPRKVKVIVTSPNMELEVSKNSDCKVFATSIQPLTRDEFYEFIFDSGVDEEDETLDKLYDLTQGEFLLLSLTVDLLGTLNVSLEDFLADFARKTASYREYVAQKFISLVPSKYVQAIYFLGVARCAFGLEILVQSGVCTAADLEYLVRRKVVSDENGLYSISETFKKHIKTLLPQEDWESVNEFLVTLYTTQLPKKPFERDVMISRHTMRHEIEYHKTLSKENVRHADANMNYVSYAKGTSFEWMLEPPSKIDIKEDEPQITEDVKPQSVEKSSYELDEEELELLHSVDANAAESVQEQRQEEDYQKTLSDYVSDGNAAEAAYDYIGAVRYYQEALEMTNDSLYDVKKPLIMTKLAICYEKAGNLDKALSHFENLSRIYTESKEPVKANYVKLNIAQMHTKSYKTAKAKELYVDILSNKQSNPMQLNAKTYLALGEIEDSISNIKGAAEYFKNALECAKATDDAILKSKAYFKYALVLDDLNRTEEAVKCYQECVESCEDADLNVYLPVAYSNLAAICQEMSDSDKAIDYYELALEADEKRGNDEGLYFVYSKLAKLYQDKEKRIDSAKKALLSAKKLSDGFYEASAYVELGDLYYAERSDENALRAYFSAVDILEKSSDKKNLEKLVTRISDIRARLNPQVYENAVKEYEND